MPRPRTRTRQEIVEAAKDVFWERGYDGTALSELEQRTGVNRSSLYAEFGSKQELFSQVLDLYHDQVVEPLLSRLEADASVAAIGEFFTGVKRVILEDRAGTRRGCLLVNTIAELSPTDNAAATRGFEFRDRLSGAFRHALERDAAMRDGEDLRSVDRRARMLSVSTLGIWVAARIDTEDAAAQCDEVAAEVRTWAAASR